jgi:hypothetical protein
MMALVNWDFYGSDEELEEADKMFKEMADMSDGVEYMGRLTPTSLKWHFTYFFKCKDMNAWVNRKRPEWNRDRNKFTHGVIWFFV